MDQTLHHLLWLLQSQVVLLPSAVQAMDSAGKVHQEVVLSALEPINVYLRWECWMPCRHLTWCPTTEGLLPLSPLKTRNIFSRT